MGQIQNQLNQLFASGVGASLAIAHSPYVKGQQEIRKAETSVKVAQEMYNTLQGEVETAQKAIEDIPDTASVEEVDKYQNYAKTFQGKAEMILEGQYNANKNLAAAQMKYGTKAQKKAGQNYLKSELREILFGRNTPDPLTQAISSLQETYDKKRGVLTSTAQRRKIIEDFTNYKGGGTV